MKFKVLKYGEDIRYQLGFIFEGIYLGDEYVSNKGLKKGKFFLGRLRKSCISKGAFVMGDIAETQVHDLTKIRFDKLSPTKIDVEYTKNLRLFYQQQQEKLKNIYDTSQKTEFEEIILDNSFNPSRFSQEFSDALRENKEAFQHKNSFYEELESFLTQYVNEYKEYGLDYVRKKYDYTSSRFSFYLTVLIQNASLYRENSDPFSIRISGVFCKLQEAKITRKGNDYLVVYQVVLS